MQTFVYADRDGKRYAVFHRNRSGKTWEHPYSERPICPACLGTSEAAPKGD